MVFSDMIKQREIEHYLRSYTARSFQQGLRMTQVWAGKNAARLDLLAIAVQECFFNSSEGSFVKVLPTTLSQRIALVRKTLRLCPPGHAAQCKMWQS